MRKRFYKMTHKSPFAGYAGARILHKDYGKFIDYSKGRVGGRAFVFKDIIKLKKKFFQFYNRKFLLGRGLIEKRKTLNVISKDERKARKNLKYKQLKL